MTVRIYDPNNEPFDVPEGRATHLILNKGWTRQRTSPTGTDDPSPEPAPTVEPTAAQRADAREAAEALFTPNAETVSALEAVERGDVTRHDSVEALFDDLAADAVEVEEPARPRRKK